MARTARNEGRRRLPSLLGCVRTERVPSNKIWTHSLTANLPRVTSTIIIGFGRCSFPDEPRASTKSLRHFPDHYRHLERTEAHRDRREKQRLYYTSVTLTFPHPLVLRPQSTSNVRQLARRMHTCGPLVVGCYQPGWSSSCWTT